MMGIAIVLAIIWILATEHTLLFYFLILPITILLSIGFIQWLFK